MEQPFREDPFGYRWIVLGVWLFTGVSGFMVLSVVGILLPAISLELSLSPVQQGILGSAAFWGNVILAIPLSWLTSRFSPKLLTTVTLAFGTVALFAQGWAPGFAVLLLGRLGFGLMVIARQPARSLLTQQWFPPREFVMVNSVGNALFGLVVGVGLVATPFILASLGQNWRGTLHVFAGYFVLLTVLWVALGREKPSPDLPRHGTSLDPGILKSVLSYRDLWIQGLGFIGPTLVWSAFLNFFPTLMLNDHGVPLHWSGGVLALGILANPFHHPVSPAQYSSSRGSCCRFVHVDDDFTGDCPGPLVGGLAPGKSGGPGNDPIHPEFCPANFGRHGISPEVRKAADTSRKSRDYACRCPADPPG